MTIHSAKGLEFENVYLIGMEEGIFPGSQSIYGGDEEIEEERRLAYVCITRAKSRLYITNTFSRMLYGQTNRNLPSRFLEEIPKELCNITKYKPAFLRVQAADLRSGQPLTVIRRVAAAFPNRFRHSIQRRAAPQRPPKINPTQWAKGCVTRYSATV